MGTTGGAETASLVPLSGPRTSWFTGTAAQIAGLAGQLGNLEPGRPPDLVVLERRREDRYASVVAADAMSWRDVPGQGLLRHSRPRQRARVDQRDGRDDLAPLAHLRRTVAAASVSTPALFVHSDGCVLPEDLRAVASNLRGPVAIAWGEGGQAERKATTNARRHLAAGTGFAAALLCLSAATNDLVGEVQARRASTALSSGSSP